jgi:ATP-dependent protease ClpP protease subunit
MTEPQQGGPRQARTPNSLAVRPALPGPDGAQNWYRITNAMDSPEGPGTPCLYIYGDIGAWGITAAQCVAELAEITGPVIDVYINSCGGEVFEGLAVYSALRNHPAKIMVRVDALAASIASVIAMAGDRVTMSPGSQLMIHDANGAVCGEPAELRQYADFLDAQSDNISQIYAERAGGTTKQWRARMQAETWYFADEAVAAGLADEVAKPARQDATAEAAAMAASWDLSVYNYAHTSREDADAPDVTTATPEPPAVEPLAPPAVPVFDLAEFRAATQAALDPMPGYQPEHLRSLMAGVAGDAPAPENPVRPAVPYEPPPVDIVPQAAPQDVAVDYWRSLFAAAANDAPAAPAREQPAPAAGGPQVVYVPEPPPPAGQVVTDYFRAVMAGVANDAPAPDTPPVSEPTPPEPVPSIDRASVRRALWEAEL